MTLEGGKDCFFFIGGRGENSGWSIGIWSREAWVERVRGQQNRNGVVFPA